MKALACPAPVLCPHQHRMRDSAQMHYNVLQLVLCRQPQVLGSCFTHTLLKHALSVKTGSSIVTRSRQA